jgi:hypothetical protein
MHDITTFPGGFTSDRWIVPFNSTWTFDGGFTTERSSVSIFLSDEAIVEFTGINRSVLVGITSSGE